MDFDIDAALVATAIVLAVICAGTPDNISENPKAAALGRQVMVGILLVIIVGIIA